MSVEELSAEISRLEKQIEFMRPKVSLYYVMESQRSDLHLSLSAASSTVRMDKHVQASESSISTSIQTEHVFDFERIQLISLLKGQDREMDELRTEIGALRRFIQSGADPEHLLDKATGYAAPRTLVEYPRLADPFLSTGVGSLDDQSPPDARDVLIDELRRQLRGALTRLRATETVRDLSADCDMLRAELDRARSNLLAVEDEVRRLKDERRQELVTPTRVAVLLRQVGGV